MSTHSHIGAVMLGGSVRSIYCHFDGGLDHQGPILLEAYDTPEKVQDLLDLGDLRVLGRKLGPAPADWETVCPGLDLCQAIGNVKVKAQIYPTVDAWLREMINAPGSFVYLRYFGYGWRYAEKIRVLLPGWDKGNVDIYPLEAYGQRFDLLRPLPKGTREAV